MKRWILALAIGLVSIAGCSSGARQTVPFSGVVKSTSGQPVTGIRVIFEPVTGEKVGATFGYDLDNEGRFEGDAFPGVYVFYLSTVSVKLDDNDSTPVDAGEAKKLKQSVNVLKKIPAAYRTTAGGGAEHKVEVASGTNLELVVAM